MKRILCILLMISILLLSACSMEPVIPETGETYRYYFDNSELFFNAANELLNIGYDAFISKTDYYAVEGSSDIEGYYIQDMTDSSYSSYNNKTVQKLFDTCNVKLVDVIFRGDIKLCSFDMCIPGKNYDYGIYYVSHDVPVYLGDPSITLLEKGNGFIYEQSASYGTKFTYYTEKLSEHFYYYEIM